MGLEVLNGARTQHDYRRCRDEWCQRFPCRVYKEGVRDGYARGRAEGEAIGRAEGYAEGYAAGAAQASKE